MDLINNYADKMLKSMFQHERDFAIAISDMQTDERLKMLRKIYRQDMLNSLKGGKFPNEELQTIYGSLQSPPKEQHYFITLSFDDTKINTCDDFQLIIQRMEKLKKWEKTKRFCFEQRSEVPNQYFGYHVHILCTSSSPKRKSQIIAEYYNTFRKYLCGKNYVDVQIVKDYMNVVNYMNGDKNDEKMKKVENDKPFREYFKLKDIYSIWNNSPQVNHTIEFK